MRSVAIAAGISLALVAIFAIGYTVTVVPLLVKAEVLSAIEEIADSRKFATEEYVDRAVEDFISETAVDQKIQGVVTEVDWKIRGAVRKITGWGPTSLTEWLKQ